MSSTYLVVAFVFFVVHRLDKKEWPQFSKALWIPLLWLLASSTTLVQILLPTKGYFTGPAVPGIGGSIEGNPIATIIFSGLILFSVIVLLKRRTFSLTWVLSNRGILLLYAYILLSIMWSPYPEVAIKRYIKMIGCLLIALLLASEEDHDKALEHVLRRYIAISLILSLYFIRTDRSIGYTIGAHGSYFMAGIAGHKNALGILCAYSLIFLLMRALRRWPDINYFDGVLALINLYFLIRAQATTALVLAILGVVLILGLKIVGNFQRIVILVMISLIVTLPVLMITINSPGAVISGAFFSATGKDATLTGRIPMWKDLIRIGQKDLILGSGYEGYWIMHYKEIWAKWTFLPVSAHNGFVEVLLNLGLLGLVILIGVIARPLFRLGSEVSISRPLSHWSLAFLILFILSNFTEAWFINLSLGWNLFLIVLMISEKDRSARLSGMITSLP